MKKDNNGEEAESVLYPFHDIRNVLYLLIIN